ncbi:YgfZ/GcvT domain-containing protein [Sulfitobacter sabulilitoris]|uniref:Folate-binding protein YgfZ n=1 Tax=Sulfitobacter sabulilitoris TaxID=2562655 RepID=A0A5S3PLG8_9RHOB|nr:folate-binding protein YgfZ [Sulfitobacter sabulilitoris]TMM55171.1 folate-binding protein YgfZ [Sulfitobacter sabulilitoris]
MTKRRILRLTGADTTDFLQGLITNDIRRLDQGLVYAAMLTPQGKYLADFFLLRDANGVLLDVAEDQADMLVQRLSMYKLRADVAIGGTDLHLHRGLGDTPADGHADPRHPAMGWRAYRDTAPAADSIDWTARRVEYLIPQAGAELTPDSFILEMGFERLGGVDFRKGCYVGQEVTARMKHKTELRKGLAQVRVEGPAEPGADILAEGKPAGTLLSRSGDRALAYLRFDRASGPMRAGDATVIWDPAEANG